MKIAWIFFANVMFVSNAFCDSTELCKQILECADKVNAWQIEYEIVSPDLKPGDKVIHRSVALRNPDKVFHWAGNVPYQSGRTWKDDVLQQRTIVSGQKCYWDLPWRRASKTWDCDSKSMFPGSLKQELLWDVVIWWPISTDSNHLLSSESYTVEDVLRDQDYQFMNTTEHVGSHSCYVLRCEGKGSIWFDCENPAIMRKREWYQIALNSIWRAELIDHQEIEAGIFCPTKITWTEVSKNPSDNSQTPLKEFSALIVSAKFNDSVPPDLFQFPEPLPGQIELTDGGYTQIRTGANEYADSILQWLKDAAISPTQIKGISRAELAFHLGVYCFGALLFFGGIRSWWRSRKQTATKEFFPQSIREDSTDVSI